MDTRAAVERYVFIKLLDEHATAEARAEICAEAERAIRAVPGVLALRVGTPADHHARSAWDLSLAVSFASLEDVERYRDHPEHRRFVDEVVKPRLAVIKAWNMELQ